MKEFILALAGSFIGSGLAFLWVFKAWKFPRIVVVPQEKLDDVSRALREAGVRRPGR